MDLATALSADSPARAGDVIWVRGGVYRGRFTSYVSGKASAPVVVRNYPGERATIDNPTDCSSYVVNGNYSWHWGLEVMSSGTHRRTKYAGTSCTVAEQTVHLDRGVGVSNNGSHTKLINMVIHDTQMGVSHWGTSDGPLSFEAYGNLIYYNGAEQSSAPERRGQGHGFYTTSKANGPTRLVDNIVHSQFSQGIRVGDDPSFRPHLEGNISYLNGDFIASMGGRNIYVGGSNDQAGNEPMTGAVIRSNYTYYRRNQRENGPGNPGASEGLNAGLWWPRASGEISGNYLAGFGGGHALQLGYWNHFKASPCERNTFHGGNATDGPVDAYGQQQCPPSTNTYLTGRPDANAVFVRPNLYEAGRAHIAIYNWENLPMVGVNLSKAGLSEGQAFEVRDAMNLYAGAVATGTYSSGSPTVSIAMTGLRRASMAGEDDISPDFRALLAHSAPEFGAFILLPR